MRILVADEHEIVRFGLRTLLEAQATWRVVAEAANGKEAIIKAVEMAPDVAIIDYSLPLSSGLEVTRQIRAKSPGTEVLIFTINDNETIIRELLQAGVRGYLLKSEAALDLIAAVRAVASGKLYLTPSLSEALLLSFTARLDREVSALSTRERQVVQLVAEGCASKVIARLLKISLKTVETHRAATMRKLNVSSSAALVRYAVRNKLVEA